MRKVQAEAEEQRAAHAKEVEQLAIDMAHLRGQLDFGKQVHRYTSSGGTCIP